MSIFLSMAVQGSFFSSYYLPILVLLFPQVDLGATATGLLDVLLS